MAQRSVPVALTIAGSDSGGGAGIQADLRTFAMHCVHGTSALTCITAQNTLGVTRVDGLPPESVTAQVEAVVTDIGVDAVKTGMLLNAAIAQATAAALTTYNLPSVVIDPVMVSRSGARLLDTAAIATIRDRLLPLATITTPNRYEAEILSGIAPTDLATMQAAAQRIHALGPAAVLVKGGGMAGELRGVDVWFDGDRLEILRTETVDTPHTHGTGCTLAAAIAAQLALGATPWDAAQAAKRFVTRALGRSLAIGAGQGPVGHFFALLPNP